jgi:replication-associated recombination protein RarA
MWDKTAARKSPDFRERLFLMHAVLLMARAPKSRRLDHCIWANYGTKEQVFQIPDHAFDMHTARGRQMGRGVEHFEAEAAKLVNEADLGPDPFKERYDNASEDVYDQQGASTSPRGPGRASTNTRLFSADDVDPDAKKK